MEASLYSFKRDRHTEWVCRFPEFFGKEGERGKQGRHRIPNLWISVLSKGEKETEAASHEALAMSSYRRKPTNNTSLFKA
jgi:hypothetical protein